MTVQVKGITAVVNRWSKTNKRIGIRVVRGLRKGSKFLYDKSQELVPVEQGDLKKSGYFKSVGKRSGMGGVYAIGYTSSYAAMVHEITTAAHGRAFNIKYASEIAAASNSKSIAVRRKFASRRPEERSKFLSHPARKYKRQIRRIIAREAKL